MNKHLYLMATASLAAIWSTSAIAQNGPAAGPASNATPATEPPANSGEIVVTAQRRLQKLQDIGIAISAFTGTELKTQGISSSADIGRITPGVFISGSVAGQSSQFSIRGVTQSDFNDAIEAPVAVYVDEAYIPSQQGQSLAAFDIDRVEVLKGPQGTLFGRNATGGLVHFVIKKPTDTAHGSFDVDYGRFNSMKVEAALGGPIAHGLTGRISGIFKRHDDIFKNLAPTGGLAPGYPTSASGNLIPCCHDVWNDNTWALRGQIQAEPTPELKIRLTGSYAKQKNDGAPYVQLPTIATVDAQGRIIDADFASKTETRVAIAPDGSNVGTSLPGVFIFAPASGLRSPGADFFGYDGRKVTGLATSLDFTKKDLNHVKDYDGSLHVDYDLGDGISFASISDYKVDDKTLFVDLEASPVNVGTFQTKARNKSFAQELRLSGSGSGLRWTTGIYYLNIDARTTRGIGGPVGSFFAAAFGMGATGLDVSDNVRLRTKSTSIFGQAEYNFAPRFTFILGGRLIREQQKYNFESVVAANSSDFVVDSGPVLFPLQTPFNDKRTTTMWAGKAQVEYRPSNGILFYLGVNRGVKGGSYNALILPPELPVNRIPYKPEVLQTVEGGLKSTLFDNLLTFNASGFYYDYKDYQAFTFQSVSGFVQNKPATNYGVDLELTARPSHYLTASINTSLMHSRDKDVEIATGVFRTRIPTYAPQKQVTARLKYDLPFDVAGGTLSFNADGAYTSSYYTNIRNFNSAKIDGRVVVNAGINWTDAAKHWRVAGRLSNVFDKRYYTVGFEATDLFGSTALATGEPRWWTASVGYSF